jgi:segregation and condensation protein B
MVKNLSLHIESLIFASEKPISFEELSSAVEETLELIINPVDIDAAIKLVIEKYNGEDYAIEIVEISGGFSFMTKGAYHLTIANYLKQTTNKKLSKAALETLSIIAYKQPVSKSEIESIRGVNCDYAVQKLLDKELIEIKGRSEGVGKPLLYGTSEKFFDYFGLKGAQDLPKLNDFEMVENSIGTPEDILVNDDKHFANNEKSTNENNIDFDDVLFDDVEVEVEVMDFTDVSDNAAIKNKSEEE